LPYSERMALDGTDRDRFGRNVLGTELQCCCTDPVTGYFRDGYCRTDPTDSGHHFVCAEMTAEFLEFSLSRGNDLVTAQPQYDFPGLKPGDRWCLSVERWLEALEAGYAPPIFLEATYAGALEYVSTNPWGELRDEAKAKRPGKGYLLVDLPGARVSFRPVAPARRFIDLLPLDAAGLGPKEIDARIAATGTAEPPGQVQLGRVG